MDDDNLHYVDERIKEISNRVGRQIETRQHELGVTANNLADRIESLEGVLTYNNYSPEQVMERADAMASERQRATEVAEREREKAAVALRIDLARMIEQGDIALRDHIHQQVEQLKVMLESGRREVDIRTNAQHEAILKAETATEKRFESVNEFRSQLADQSNTFVPREVADTAHRELRSLIDSNTARIARAEGAASQEDKDVGKGQFNVTTLISVVIAAIAVLGVIITIVNL